MSEITLPSNIYWITPDLAVAIVPGDKCPTPTGCPRFTRQMCRWFGWHPPQEWAQYDKPCEWRDACAAGDDTVRCICPTSDGHHVSEVRWPCDVSEMSGQAMNDGGYATSDHFKIGRAILQVGPVISYSDWEITATPTPCITIDDYSHAVLMLQGEGDGALGYPIDLNSSPIVGRDFALIVRKVTS